MVNLSGEMNFIHNVKTVAHYEAKTLGRSWFFRLFALGALFMFTMMNIGLFSPVGGEDWAAMAIASALPHINLYMLNIGQSIVVIFLAADFLKKDKKLDTNEVLYTRSISNLEYVIGKMWGILRLFLGLNIVVLMIGLLINLTARNMQVDLMSYISHLLLISVPTLIFSLGLAFLMMSIIRNQAVTFLLLLGYAALNMFYLNQKAGYIFDYMAFGLPMFKSSITGYGYFSAILFQRLTYLFAGLAMVSITTLIFKRLPQSKLHHKITFFALILFLAGTAFSAFKTYGSYTTVLKEKERVIESNSKYEDELFLTVGSYDIDLKHNNNSISASAIIEGVNNNSQSISRLIFSLNPGLAVKSVKLNGSEVAFERDYNILIVNTLNPLGPGEKVNLEIGYSGTIIESYCFPVDHGDPKLSPYRIAMVNIPKRQVFLTQDYVLLPPEAHWYPVPGLNVFPTNPAKMKADFSVFDLKVETSPALIAVGAGTTKGVDGKYDLSSDSPIPGMSLVIGKYINSSIIADSIIYNVWLYPGHDYFSDDFSEISDTLTHIIGGIMTDLENTLTSRYPYKTLNLVEVPVQFYSWPVMNSQKRAEVQPGMLLMPERLATINQAGFAREIKRQKKRMESNSQVITDRELQIRILTNFFRNTFVSGSNVRFSAGNIINEPSRYLLGPSFYLFRNNFYSNEYPVINAVFETHLQKIAAPQRGFQAMMGGLSESDKANIVLKDISFEKLLAKNPGTDTLRAVLTVKGDYLFNLMRSKADIEPFNKWLSAYMESNKFKRVSFEEFDTAIEQRFGFSVTPFLDDWFRGEAQPGFLFTGLRLDEIIVGDRSRYRITFDASNPEPVDGLFNIAFRTGGPGMGGRGGGSVTMSFGPGGGGSGQVSVQGRGMDIPDIDRIIHLGPGEAKRISIILDAQPRAMIINTLFSKNLPGELTLPLTTPNKAGREITPVPDEITLASIPPFTESYEIVTDNEDAGFRSNATTSQSPLKEFFGIKNKRTDTYEQIRLTYAPEHWQPIVQSTFYGKYARSAIYTRGGTGDRTVEWFSVLPEAGYYEVSTYIGKSANRMTVRTGGPGGGGPGGANPGGGGQESESFKDFHYIIQHDDGTDEVTLEYETATDGWNNLGTFYLSADTAKVFLTNKTTGRMVVGDAIKWIKQK